MQFLELFPNKDCFNKRRNKKMDMTLSISEDRFEKLKDVANLFNIKPEDLVCISIDELLSRPDENFQKTVDYVLKKNADLYQRLA